MIGRDYSQGRLRFPLCFKFSDCNNEEAQLRLRGMKKKLPVFKTDKEVEGFLDKDLSDYLHSENFAPFAFDYQAEQKSINSRPAERNQLRVKREPAAQHNQRHK